MYFGNNKQHDAVDTADEAMEEGSDNKGKSPKVERGRGDSLTIAISS